VTEERAIKVAKKYPGGVEVAKFEAISEEGDKYGIMLTPAVMINEKLVAAGKVLSEAEIEKLVGKELEAEKNS
jgi:protein-disulfide isomerase